VFDDELVFDAKQLMGGEVAFDRAPYGDRTNAPRR
jgi:hypothetical protein